MNYIKALFLILILLTAGRTFSQNTQPTNLDSLKTAFRKQSQPYEKLKIA